MKKVFALIALLCMPLMASAQIIPQPNSITIGKGRYTLPQQATLALPTVKECKAAGLHIEKKDIADLSAQYSHAFALVKKSKKTANITLLPAKLQGKEGTYRIDISPKGIVVRANSAAGFFYALQSLLQMEEQRGFQCQTIEDSPRFDWRGIHHDVSRHFFSKEYIKRELRMMARYKMNKFHWHLTDGAGWRIQINRYPQLTDSTAFRPQTDYNTWLKSGKKFCPKDAPGAYGGYYTQEDVREVVAYARKLHIDVVPEVDVPGHSWEVLAVLPELGCTGKPYQNNELCIGKEATFAFIENVLDEVIDLFPSPFIHIGGDEADRSHWEKCPDCRRRMQAEGLKDVKELQSYMTKRLETFLEKHGRHLLGWDEILEGGLSPNATVMSWRGETGGIEAAKMGNKVIMTPVGSCYLDSPQDDPTAEPAAFGSYLPLKRVYDYDPVSPQIRASKADSLVLGMHACLWTEMVGSDADAEYLLYPRMLAVAETGWSTAANKDYSRFHRAALRECKLMKSWGYHPFDLSRERGNRKEYATFTPHLAYGKRVDYGTTTYPEKYAAAGKQTLTDGRRGGFRHQDEGWQGFLNQPVRVTIDMDSIQTIHQISMDFYQSAAAWIYLPKTVTYSYSTDGIHFTALPAINHNIPQDKPKLTLHTFNWQGSIKARYIRIDAAENGVPGGWLFTDEVIVR